MSNAPKLTVEEVYAEWPQFPGGGLATWCKAQDEIVDAAAESLTRLRTLAADVANAYVREAMTVTPQCGRAWAAIERAERLRRLADPEVVRDGLVLPLLKWAVGAAKSYEGRGLKLARFADEVEALRWYCEPRHEATNTGKIIAMLQMGAAIHGGKSNGDAEELVHVIGNALDEVERADWLAWAYYAMPGCSLSANAIAYQMRAGNDAPFRTMVRRGPHASAAKLIAERAGLDPEAHERAVTMQLNRARRRLRDLLSHVELDEEPRFVIAPPGSHKPRRSACCAGVVFADGVRLPCETIDAPSTMASPRCEVCNLPRSLG